MATTYRIAVIGDWESVMGFRALGLDTYPVNSTQEAGEKIRELAKTDCAVIYLTEQLAKARSERIYLESVLEEIAEAETEQDFTDIRGELRDAGFLRTQGKKGINRPAKPREFCTSSGFRVLVGRNNRQNDQLTTKTADHRDLWFHTQKIHGSHVILWTEGRQPDAQSLTEAAGLAKIAAWYSQARESGNVPVDYTQVKNVKKPSGARPGMVIYSTCRTVNVTPEEELVTRLSVRR